MKKLNKIAAWFVITVAVLFTLGVVGYFATWVVSMFPTLAFVVGVGLAISLSLIWVSEGVGRLIRWSLRTVGLWHHQVGDDV